MSGQTTGAPPEAEALHKSRRRGNLVFFGALTAVLALLPVGYFALLTPTQPPPAPLAAPPSPSVPELKVTRIEGEVTVRRGGGEWLPASEGEPLLPADAVRTAPGASAVLVGREAYEVTMEGGTAVAVDELTSSISRLLLETGMATATVRGAAQHTFQVRAAASDATATTRGGVFTMTNNGAGTVAVGTREGEVELSAQKKAVIVRAGQQSLVRPGHAPTDPVAIPQSLLLKVQWPAPGELTTRSLKLVGQVEPGSRVEVGGRWLSVDDKGRFTQELPLAEGTNRVEVKARGVGGTSSAEVRAVKVDTTPPTVGIDRNLWER